jgi:hypothetical protein
LRGYIVGAYLGNRGGEDNNFIQLADPLHELVDTGSLDNIYVVILAFNLDGDGKVGLVQDLANISINPFLKATEMTNLEAAVHQRLIQIKNQALLALEARRNGA